MEIAGVKLIGLDVVTAHKVLFTLVLVAAFVILRMLLGLLVRLFSRPDTLELRFWTQQFASLLTGVILLMGLVSIWFNNSAQLATILGLFTAGLAFALQKVVTAFAGYFVILRGNIFKVGDRIVLGKVRGDVIGVGFIQTTVMEMGQSPPEGAAEPAVWVEGRQFTGRIITISNAQIFDEPVFNYSRDFPMIWEEMHLPVGYTADHHRAEQLMLACAEHHTASLQQEGRAGLRRLLDRYGMPEADLTPRVYFSLTDNWVSLPLRYIAPAHGARAMKDAMSRELLREFAAAGIGIASSTYDIVGFPPIRIMRETVENAASASGAQG